MTLIQVWQVFERSSRSGSIHEDEQRGSGLAHYLEHLVSGGTTSKRSEKRYRKLLAECGGASNAYTTLDHTTVIYTPQQKSYH